MTDTALHIANACKRYQNGFQAVRDISFVENNRVVYTTG